MKKLLSVLFISLAMAFTMVTTAEAKQYKFNFVMHSDTNNAFWAAVHKGFKDACAQIDASCQAMSKVNADLTMTMVSFILRLR